MTRFISTWFYIQGQEEGGRFAQIREDAASEVFRDIYRRCIGVFFARARRANPASSLILYLNRPWDTSLKFEEAYVLSMAYSVLDHDPGTANDFIRRLWTQPLKPRNVGAKDLGLALWHVPAEKKYGLARMYRRLQRQGLSKFMKGSDQAFMRRTAKLLGIPQNSPSKFILEIIQASLMRLRRIY